MWAGPSRSAPLPCAGLLQKHLYRFLLLDNIFVKKQTNQVLYNVGRRFITVRVEVSLLSDQINRLADPKLAAAFYRTFRRAWREHQIYATDLRWYFKLPEVIQRQGTVKTYQRTVCEMTVLLTPEYEQWFTQTVEALTLERDSAQQTAIILDQLQSGTLDFQELAKRTRQQMRARPRRGRAGVRTSERYWPPDLD